MTLFYFHLNGNFQVDQLRLNHSGDTAIYEIDFFFIYRKQESIKKMLWLERSISHFYCFQESFIASNNCCLIYLCPFLVVFLL